MGWFLSRKKGGRSSRSKKSKRSLLARNGWDPQRTLRAIRIVGFVAAAVLLVAGWQVGADALRDYTAARHAPADTPLPRITLVDAPAWMTEPIADDVRAAVAAELTTDPMDRDALRRAIDALHRCAWVAQPQDPNQPPAPRLERLDGLVKVHADYRQPAALVMAPTPHDQRRLTAARPLIGPGDVFHLVDAFGRRLPASYSGDTAPHVGLPLITRVHAPAPPVGHYWPGEDVAGALKLANLVASDIYFAQVQAIDAFARDSHGRPHLVLRTDLQSPAGAVWGPPPGRERVYEPDAQTKRLRLLAVFERRGRLDGGGKLLLVDGPTTGEKSGVRIQPAH